VRKWVGQVDEQVIRLYTHIHDRASQAAMQRLAEANQGLQGTEGDRDGQGRGSAQTQHSEREDENEQDAK
jgi:hypothetical protein